MYLPLHVLAINGYFRPQAPEIRCRDSVDFLAACTDNRPTRALGAAFYSIGTGKRDDEYNKTRSRVGHRGATGVPLAGQHRLPSR